MNSVKVYYLAPGDSPQWRSIGGDVESLVALMGGCYPERIALTTDGLTLFVDDEGALKAAPLNFTVMNTPVRGPAVLCRCSDDGALIDLNEDDVALFREQLDR